jgi:thymidylate kinase
MTRWFDILGGQNIPYAVMRSYAGLPEKIDHDVDVLVEDLPSFETATREAASETGWIIVRRVQKYSFLSLYFVCPGIDPLAIIQIDAWSPFSWKGIELVSQEVLKERRLYRGHFYILPPGAEAAISLIKNLVYHGKIQEKYKSSMPAMVGADRASFCLALASSLGGQLAEQLSGLTSQGDWHRIEALAPQLRRCAIKRAFLTRPFRQLGRWSAFFSGHVLKFFHPTGLFIVLIGPDGSGKSTVSQGLQRLFKPLFTRTRYFHSHFAVLPRLRDLVKIAKWRDFKDEASDASLVANPAQREIKFSPLRSLVYLVYYGLDYVLGNPIMWYTRGKGEFIIFDRYYYDYLIQRGMSLPRWIINLVMRMIPFPDVVIYLKNSPDVVLARKPELTREEIARQGAACSELISRLPCAYVVETVGSPEETIQQVARVVLDNMSELYKRLGHNLPY